MKCLLLQCPRFSYKLDHQVAGELSANDDKSKIYENALVLFVAIEKGDTSDSVIKASEEMQKLINKINPKYFIINPFAHLSSNLASLKDAQELSTMLYNEVKKLFENTVLLEFGWYKSFDLNISGSSHSQLFREF